MDGYAVPHCNNSAAKGWKDFDEKKIPRNSERQTVGVKNINREDWVPANNSLLCEVNTFEFFTIR